MPEEPNNNFEGNKGIDAQIESSLDKLDIDLEQLEQGLESVGGAQGLQVMFEELPESEQQRIISLLEEDHNNRMNQIIRDQEKAGKIMDDGLEFIWNPKFVFGEAMKNSNDPGLSVLTTALVMASGASIGTGLGASLIGTAKHFASRIREIRELRRHNKAMSEAE